MPAVNKFYRRFGGGELDKEANGRRRAS